jgi:hypothetical protein
MQLSIQGYEHDRLYGMSFTEVFREFVELTHRHWERQQMEYHIVRRALRCCRQRWAQAEYAAVFRSEIREDNDSTKDTAW